MQRLDWQLKPPRQRLPLAHRQLSSPEVHVLSFEHEHPASQRPKSKSIVRMAPLRR
jgi:hypothetical protein